MHIRELLPAALLPINLKLCASSNVLTAYQNRYKRHMIPIFVLHIARFLLFCVYFHAKNVTKFCTIFAVVFQNMIVNFISNFLSKATFFLAFVMRFLKSALYTLCFFAYLKIERAL